MDTPTGPPAHPTFMVEGYWSEASLEVAQDSARRLGASLDDLAPDSPRRRAVSMTVVPADKAAYWIVEAPSRELLAQACDRAGLLIERIVEAVELVPADDRSVVRIATGDGQPGWSREGGDRDVPR